MELFLERKVWGRWSVFPKFVLATMIGVGTEDWPLAMRIIGVGSEDWSLAMRIGRGNA